MSATQNQHSKKGISAVLGQSDCDSVLQLNRPVGFKLLHV